MVSIIDDNALEGDHEFTVSIGMTVPPITIDNTPIEVMIEDNESEFCETEDKWYLCSLSYSRDCPIFYMRKKVQKDLVDQDQLVKRFGASDWWWSTACLGVH